MRRELLKMMIQGFRAYRVRTLLMAFAMLMVSIQVSAEGWTPTSAGLIVDLKPGDRIMLSVMYNDKEYFVSDYELFTSDSADVDFPFNYEAGHTLKLIPKASAAAIWTIDAPLTRTVKDGTKVTPNVPKGTAWVVDGKLYTMYSSSGYTLLSYDKNANSDGWKIKGDLSDDKDNKDICDVAFAVPTVRADTQMFNVGGYTTLDYGDRNRGNGENGTKAWAFDGKTGYTPGIGTYREVFMFALPRSNKPRTYNNCALVGFNLTDGNLEYKEVTISVGQADWIFGHKQSKGAIYMQIPRTLFRLYILEKEPFISCPNSYFFAYNEQDYHSYKNIDPDAGTSNSGDRTSNATTKKHKIYTTDHLFCMDTIEGQGNIWRTDYMYVPAPDSTYYYVGDHDRYRNGGTLGGNGASSAFTKIRQLPVKGLAGSIAPIGACGRMVVDTTTNAANLGVAFEPAGYFIKISNGRNVKMVQVDENTWMTEEMWSITGQMMDLSCKVMLYSGTEFSDNDPGVEIADWSVDKNATEIPLAVGSGTAEGKSGWARIHTSNAAPNGAIEFVEADSTMYVCYHNNGHFGEEIPNQYPTSGGSTTVIIQDARLLQGYVFTGWNTAADSSGTNYTVGQSVDLSDLSADGSGKKVLHLYAKAKYTGAINVAMSFVKESDGKRYFLTHPGVAPRYATARTFDDWTNVYQGMGNVDNSDPNYLTSYKIIGKETICKECEPGEYVLDPHRQTMHGNMDSLVFYESYQPEADEYIGLYYINPVTVLSNNNWAGLFQSSKGWPTPAKPCIDSTVLFSTHYLTGLEKDPYDRLQRDSVRRSNIKYNPSTNYFDGAPKGDSTIFTLSGVGVVDAHYIILPDTTDAEKPWTESITFGYHDNQQTERDVWSKLIGKQLLAQMKVGNEIIYFHPNDNKTITSANLLRLSNDYRLTHAFSYIRDARVINQNVVAEADLPEFEQPADAFHCTITSGHSSPRDVKYNGQYIDMVDTLRVWLRPAGGSKIKRYYGRWEKKGVSDGLTVKPDGSRYRDILVTTKIYHHGDTLTSVRVVPEKDSYNFGSLQDASADVNFKLQFITYQQMLDKSGAWLHNDTISIRDTTGLDLRSATFTLKTSEVFKKGSTTERGIRLTTMKENISPSQSHDTLTVSGVSVKIGGTTYSGLTASVPLTQVSTQGTECVWSVESGGTRYYIVGSDSGLKFRTFSTSKNRLVQGGAELIKGSKDAANSDNKYITPWKWTDIDVEGQQLTLETKYGINKVLQFANGNVGTPATLENSDASTLTFIMDSIHTDANGNYEEFVRLKYELKWLKFEDNAIKLVANADSAQASTFLWSYMIPEYHLQNNGTYPSHQEAVFGYNSSTSVAVTAAYKAYVEYSMSVNNKLLYLCRTDEERYDTLTAAGKEWKTSYSVPAIVSDARDFDGDPNPTSGLSKTTSGFTTTITPSSATSPMDVKIGGEYVNIVDTLLVTVGLQDNPNTPVYRFNTWDGVSSISDACLKIPLVRKTYHAQNFDTVACVVVGDEYNFAFRNELRKGHSEDSVHTFTLRTMRRKGTSYHDVDHNVVATTTTLNVDSTNAMDLSNTALAEVRLLDDYGSRPNWCKISGKGKNTVTVKCLSNGVRSPRVAYLVFAYVVFVDTDNDPSTPSVMQFVNYRVSVSQASLFQYANNQHLVHSRGASGDSLVNGMQQVHENKRILYYYNPNPEHPAQYVELPVRERSFYGWWRWYREGKDERDNNVGDRDVPDSLWQTPPRNVGKYNFPYRIIGDSVKVPNPAHELDASKPDSIKVLVTQGRYTVFHYPSRAYTGGIYNAKKDPPAKSPLVYPPINKETLTYVVDLGNYYDNLPLSMSDINQIDTAKLDTTRRIVEPTLSLREIFELHPWTEMAEKLEAYKDDTTAAVESRNNNYMEDHVVRAPILNPLLLETEQRYIYDSIHAGGHSESLLGYYMRDENWSSMGSTPDANGVTQQDTMIWCGGWPDDSVKMGWYTYDPVGKSYTRCNYSTTGGDDYLKVPAKTSVTAGKSFDTVYYCLRARSRKSTFDGSGKVTTVDGQYYFNICRYMIIYHRKPMYGPVLEATSKGVTKALITNDEIEQTYSVLARLNFDYNKTGTDYQVYPHPLPWADASYGYSYPAGPTIPDNRYHNDFAPNFPGPGEYGLINKIPISKYWHTLEQHGGAANGYMIYCDGMSSAGQVAALSLDTTLCAGQQMYLSAYVANPSNQNGKAKPNFLFSVQGSRNGSTWDDITAYMTGEIDPKDRWYQIFFPIEPNHEENNEYRKFRVRIYNMSSDWDGNDFAIDDICIFANRPPLVAYQANTTCIGKNETDSITHVVLRVDYQGFTRQDYNDKDVYYTVEQVSKTFTDTTYVPMLDNFIGQAASGDTVYGVVHLPKHNHVTDDADSVFSSVETLVERFDQTLADSLAGKSVHVYRVGYVYETVEDKSVRPVMYIVHKAKMTPDNHYTVRMSLSPADLLSTICAMVSRLKISNRMMLELNGEVQDGRDVPNLCANTTYEIGMRVKGSLYRDSIAPIELDGSCMNDWLLYGDTAEASSEERYGYKYSDIEKVITKILRAELPDGTNTNQFVRNLGEISRNELTRVKSINNVSLSSANHPYQIITDLVNNGFLSLYQGKKTAAVTHGDSVCYMVFPIIGTGSDLVQDMSVEVCPTPLYIKLAPRDSVAPVPLMIGGLQRDTTESGLPVPILVDAQTANSEIAIRIDSIVPLKGIYSVELQSTNDPDYLEGIHTLNLQPNLPWPTNGDYYHKGDTMLLHPASGNNYTMQPGYNYTFNIVMSTHGGSLDEEDGPNAGCPVGTIPFTVCVVPDYLRWNPKTTSANRWNNADNWIGVTAQNRPIHADAHYVPLATTKVVIPSLPDTMPYPVLSNTFTKADQANMVGYQYNTCAVIRFLPGAAIGGQQYLNYDNAIIDMTMPQQKWALRSAPVKGMVSGDLYMSKADMNAVSNPWEVGEFDADGRNYQLGTASFWLSVYNHETRQKGSGGDLPAVAGEATWSKVTNGMTLKLDTAQGWAVYGRTKSGSAPDVRLPKHDTRYYYFDPSGGRIDALFDAVTRDANAGKLAYYRGSGTYTLTKAVADSSFVFGNPTMGYIDIWGFIADNSLKQEFSYLNASGRYTTVSKASADVTTDTITELDRYLPPMHAMVVKAAAATSHDFTLHANRIITKASQKVRPLPTPSSAPARKAHAQVLPQGIMTVTAVNPVSDRCVSRLLIGQGYNDAIISGEDAVLTTVNIDNFSMTNTPTTPFNIYAVNTGYGLCIDLRDSVVNVPLSFYMSDLPFDDVTKLWFTGVNSIAGPLVLYDDFTGIERTIIDGICINIETPQANHERRYYIRRPGYVPEQQVIDPIATGNQPTANSQEPMAEKILHNGHVYVLRNGSVYSIFGQKLR